MNAFNPLSFVERDEIDLVIQKKKVKGYAVDLDELTRLGKRFPWFGDRMRGLEIKQEDVPEEDLLEVAAVIVAAAVAPDTRGAEREQVVVSARKIRAHERIEIMNKIMEESFEKIQGEVGEGNVTVPQNRATRRASRSKAGGSKRPTSGSTEATSAPKK